MSASKSPEVVMLAGEGELSRLIFHELDERVELARIITEPPVSRLNFLKRRLKNLGLTRVLGQVMFKIFAELPLKICSSGRVEEILEENGLRVDELPESRHVHVKTVNSSRVVETLNEFAPDLVVVNGTRIIQPEVFANVDAPFVNIHVGITPRYRGVHGGYWALAEDRPELCGVTVHLIDEGVDTGPVLYQDTVEVTDRDNFVTYPYLQAAAAVPLVEKVVEAVKNNSLEPKTNPGMESCCRTHPTLWEYLYYRVFKGVK